MVYGQFPSSIPFIRLDLHSLLVQPDYTDYTDKSLFHPRDSRHRWSIPTPCFPDDLRPPSIRVWFSFSHPCHPCNPWLILGSGCGSNSKRISNPERVESYLD